MKHHYYIRIMDLIDTMLQKLLMWWTIGEDARTTECFLSSCKIPYFVRLKRRTHIALKSARRSGGSNSIRTVITGNLEKTRNPNEGLIGVLRSILQWSAEHWLITAVLANSADQMDCMLCRGCFWSRNKEQLKRIITEMQATRCIKPQNSSPCPAVATSGACRHQQYYRISRLIISTSIFEQTYSCCTKLTLSCAIVVITPLANQDQLCSLLP